MVEVVGVGKGKTRFDASDAEKLRALRASIHLNLAAGAVKCKEYYGALAAAEVALDGVAVAGPVLREIPCQVISIKVIRKQLPQLVAKIVAPR